MTFNKAYSNPELAAVPYIPPDIETFQCDSQEAKRITRSAKAGPGWYYWRIDDGERCPVGPFDSEAEALEDARD